MTSIKQLKKGRTPAQASVLITGGAGFIGTNLADHLLQSGHRVRILDNLARNGVERNLDWLCAQHDRDSVDIRIEDVRDARAVSAALEGIDHVYHLAAQVAVTTSIEAPEEDFGVNVRGTLNLLESIRHRPQPPSLVFTSTNKVYGHLEDVALHRNGTRYEPVDPSLLRWGIDELRPLHFGSPYGCSKGAADQYVLDYARTYGLKTVVFRMSCIYGPHQLGTEDQGWVAHFLIRSRDGVSITIYGDGLQVRDVLFVDDLTRALILGQKLIDRLSGCAFNIGGGAERTLSLLELLQLIEMLHGQASAVRFAPWRASDQRYFVADVRRFREFTGWSPQIDVPAGVERLYRWLVDQQSIPVPAAIPLPATPTAERNTP
jgi:CDP-paratose 2-epimerase